MSNKDERKNQGYVVFIRMYSTADNASYDGGTIRVMYGGVGKTMLGDARFEPYKTEKSANQGRKAWENLYEKIGDLDINWRYQVGGVMPVSEKMYQEMEEQRTKDDDIVRKAMSQMFSDMLEKTEKDNSRRRLKRIK